MGATEKKGDSVSENTSLSRARACNEEERKITRRVCGGSLLLVHFEEKAERLLVEGRGGIFFKVIKVPLR